MYMYRFKDEFYVIEELKEKKGKFSVTIIRSIRYNTIREAEEKFKTLEPIENGTLKIRKDVVYECLSDDGRVIKRF